MFSRSFHSVIFFISLQVLLTTANVNETDILSEQIRKFWFCQQKASQDHIKHHGTSYCPTFFDGWICWEAIPTDSHVSHSCSEGFFESSSEKIINGSCEDDGAWNINGNDVSLVNHTLCDVEALMVADLQSLSEIAAMVDHVPQPEDITVEHAYRSCIRNVLTLPLPTDDKPFCRRTFDGWGCWKDTRAGETAAIPCPDFIPGFVSTRKAYKLCGPDGSWFRHPHTNKTWSNYTTCIDQEDLMFRQYINAVYIAGYSISAAALLLSLLIFYCFKSLKCTRTTIHKNLFISFIVNNVMWIVWYTEIIEHPTIIINNQIGCQILHVIVHYFMVSNYFWMFCEGLYLHTVLVVTFVSEEIIIKGFYLIGWGIPLALIITYATLRASDFKHTAFCWMQDSVYQWILSGPVCLSLLLNLLFLINIVRVLVTKLRAVNSPDANQTRKAARATLILIPLLGLHYLLTPFRPDPRSSGEAVYEIISAVATSLQGLCVAFLFCFLNGEVISALRRKWNLTRLRRTAGKQPAYGITTSVSFLGRSPSEPDGKFYQETPMFPH